MPYRIAPPRSDRGNIKDIQNRNNESIEENPDMEPTQTELRIKSLYEYALVTRDQSMIESLGIIAISGAPKDPIVIFRHKEYVESLKVKLAEQIKQTADELAPYFAVPDDRDSTESWEIARGKWKQKEALKTILDDGPMVKNASLGSRRSFRRVIK